MPIDPFHLDPDRRRPPEKTVTPFFHPIHLVGWVIVLIAGIALALIWGDKQLTAGFLKVSGTLLVLIFLWRLKAGWDDDGIAGLWYFWHQPWGSSLLGDDPGPRDTDPFTSTIWWVGLALTVLSIAAAIAAYL